MYAVYDMKDGETCVGVFETVKEVAKSLDIKTNHVSSIISKKKKYKSRYIIMSIKTGEA
jgi:thymidine phosphorylase